MIIWLNEKSEILNNYLVNKSWKAKFADNYFDQMQYIVLLIYISGITSTSQSCFNRRIVEKVPSNNNIPKQYIFIVKVQGKKFVGHFVTSHNNISTESVCSLFLSQANQWQPSKGSQTNILLSYL